MYGRKNATVKIS